MKWASWLLCVCEGGGKGARGMYTCRFTLVYVCSSVCILVQVFSATNLLQDPLEEELAFLISYSQVWSFWILITCVLSCPPMGVVVIYMLETVRNSVRVVKQTLTVMKSILILLIFYGSLGCVSPWYTFISWLHECLCGSLLGIKLFCIQLVVNLNVARVGFEYYLVW